jgi:hypothetical protein
MARTFHIYFRANELGPPPKLRRIEPAKCFATLTTIECKPRHWRGSLERTRPRVPGSHFDGEPRKRPIVPIAVQINSSATDRALGNWTPPPHAAGGVSLMPLRGPGRAVDDACFIPIAGI